MHLQTERSAPCSQDQIWYFRRSRLGGRTKKFTSHCGSNQQTTTRVQQTCEFVASSHLPCEQICSWIRDANDLCPCQIWVSCRILILGPKLPLPDQLDAYVRGREANTRFVPKFGSLVQRRHNTDSRNKYISCNCVYLRLCLWQSSWHPRPDWNGARGALRCQTRHCWVVLNYPSKQSKTKGTGVILGRSEAKRHLFCLPLEVLLPAPKAHGDTDKICCKYGMFAATVWERHQQEMFLMDSVFLTHKKYFSKMSKRLVGCLVPSLSLSMIASEFRVEKKYGQDVTVLGDVWRIQQT